MPRFFIWDFLGKQIPKPGIWDLGLGNLEISHLKATSVFDLIILTSLQDRLENSRRDCERPRPVIRDDRNAVRGRRRNKRSRVPEHVTNPEKFTKYDLSDVKLRHVIFLSI